MFSKSSLPFLTIEPAQVLQAFAMSKSIVVDESDAGQFEAYRGLSYLEFLECIGRLAYARCAGSEMEFSTDLAEKILEMLHDMLRLINCSAQWPNRYAVE